MPEELPKGWVKTTLGEIRHDESTGISREQIRGETFELYSVPAFSEGKPEIVSGDEIGSNKILVSPGDVLLCKINPRINRAWVVGESSGYRQIASTEWIVFSKQHGISSDYLHYFFNQDSFRDYLAANVSGVGGSLMRIRPSVIETYPFPLPPTAEQERIVAKLNAANSRLERAEIAARRAKERLQRYIVAVLNAAVTGELTRDWRQAQWDSEKSDLETGEVLLQRLLIARRARWVEDEFNRLCAIAKEPKIESCKLRYEEPAPLDITNLPDIPPSWAWAHLKQLGFIVGGLTKNPRRIGLRLNLPYLRVANVYANELRLDNIKTIGVYEGELDKLLLENGDLLIVEGNGSKDQIGRLAITTFC